MDVVAAVAAFPWNKRVAEMGKFLLFSLLILTALPIRAVDQVTMEIPEKEVFGVADQVTAELLEKEVLGAHGTIRM